MRKPTFLRWSEEAEAEHVRAWAALEPEPAPEPQSAADRSDECVRPVSPPRHRPVLFPWLRSLLGTQDP